MCLGSLLLLWRSDVSKVDSDLTENNLTSLGLFVFSFLIVLAVELTEHLQIPIMK